MNFSKVLLVILILYIISLATSLAAMEGFSGFLILAFLLGSGYYFYKYVLSKKVSISVQATLSLPPSNAFRPLGIGPDYLCLIIAVIILIGGFLVEGSMNERIRTMGQVRWILIVYALTASLYYLREHWRLMVKVFIVLAIAIGLYSSLQAFLGYDPFRPGEYKPSSIGGVTVWRAKGFFNNTMAYSYNIGVWFCVLLALAQLKVFKDIWKYLLWAACGALGLSLLLTFTRGAWLAILVALPAMWFLNNPKKSWRPILILLLVLGAGLAVVQPLRSRLASVQQLESRSISQRFDLWRANWAMFKDNPWFGVGYNQNKFRTQEYNIKLMGREAFVANAHNNFLQWLGGTGFIATTCWLALMLYFMWLPARWLWRNEIQDDLTRALVLGVFGGQIFFHFGGLTQATFFDKEAAHMFFFWISIVLATRSLLVDRQSKI